MHCVLIRPEVYVPLSTLELLVPVKYKGSDAQAKGMWITQNFVAFACRNAKLPSERPSIATIILALLVEKA